MPRSLPPSSSEDDLVLEDEKNEEILGESSSSSKDIEDIYFRGGSRRPSVDSTVDTGSAPISFANDFNDSNDSIGGKLFQIFNESSNEGSDIQAELFSRKSFRNHSIQTSNRQSTPVLDPTIQSKSRVDTEIIFKCWGVTYEVRSSVDERKPCCIFCCCICFKCF